MGPKRRSLKNSFHIRQGSNTISGYVCYTGITLQLRIRLLAMEIAWELIRLVLLCIHDVIKAKGSFGGIRTEDGSCCSVAVAPPAAGAECAALVFSTDLAFPCAWTLAGPCSAPDVLFGAGASPSIECAVAMARATPWRIAYSTPAMLRVQRFPSLATLATTVREESCARRIHLWCIGRRLFLGGTAVRAGLDFLVSLCGR